MEGKRLEVCAIGRNLGGEIIGNCGAYVMKGGENDDMLHLIPE